MNKVTPYSTTNACKHLDKLLLAREEIIASLLEDNKEQFTDDRDGRLLFLLKQFSISLLRCKTFYSKVFTCCWNDLLVCRHPRYMWDLDSDDGFLSKRSKEQFIPNAKRAIYSELINAAKIGYEAFTVFDETVKPLTTVDPELYLSEDRVGLELFKSHFWVVIEEYCSFFYSKFESFELKVDSMNWQKERFKSQLVQFLEGRGPIFERNADTLDWELELVIREQEMEAALESADEDYHIVLDEEEESFARPYPVEEAKEMREESKGDL